MAVATLLVEKVLQTLFLYSPTKLTGGQRANILKKLNRRNGRNIYFVAQLKNVKECQRLSKSGACHAIYRLLKIASLAGLPRSQQDM
jgi:hypothetical protein